MEKMEEEIDFEEIIRKLEIILEYIKKLKNEKELSNPSFH